MATVFENKPSYMPQEEAAALHNAQIKERYERLKNAEASQLAESFSAGEKTAYSYPAERKADYYAPPAETTKNYYAVPDKREITSYTFPQASAPALAPEPERSPEREYSAGYPQAPAREEPVTNGFVHTKVESPLFTPEMLDRTIRREYYDFGPAEAPAAPAANLQTADMRTAFEAVEKPLAEVAVAAEMPVAAVNVAPAEESYGLNAFAMKMVAAFAALVILLLSVIGINTRVIRQKTQRLKDLEERRSELSEENAELEQRILDAKSYERVLEYVERQGMIPAAD